MGQSEGGKRSGSSLYCPMVPLISLVFTKVIIAQILLLPILFMIGDKERCKS
jgi:hypothetical protein